MHKEQKETKQLDTGWRVIFIIWGAILASLGIYLVVCISIEKELHVNMGPDFPLETLRYALFGVSIATLFVVHFLRKFLLKTSNSTSNSTHTSSAQHPAVGKYATTVVITSALLESIGIYGVVLFLIAKDTLSLYQLLIVSAAAMIHFRPRKDELLSLAAQMEQNKTAQQIN
jgi:hypothetical protein